MDIPTLTRFFMWCTILNGALLVLWTTLWLSAPGWVYGIQRRWFPLPREVFDIVMYSFLGLFKIIFLAFCVAPFLALLIIG